jgi:cobaltochelatase CobT
VNSIRRQQQVDELCAAAIRAISGERDLQFRGRRLHRGRRALPLFAPHLHPRPDTDDFGSFRGAADGLALRLRESDAALHARACPAAPVERLVFDLLEQFRVESLAGVAMPGIAHNLRHRFEAWSLAFHHAGLTDTDHGILLYTLAQIGRARVTGEAVVEATEDLIEATRGALGPLIGHALAGLRRERRDQAAYAVHALAIARTVGAMLHRADEDPATAQREAESGERAAFSLVMALDAEVTEGFATAVSGHSRVLGDSADGYRIFTTAYDRQHDAATLVRAALLKECRDRLDARIEREHLNLPMLVRTLHALLARPQRDGWDGGQEEGLIDGRRLAQLVTSPSERRLFRNGRIEPAADCALTLLIDCSGSMKEHAEPVAVLADVLARALERAGVASEVLGFTTGAWNGGRALHDWQRAGKPLHPGRLNEACHLVFKPFETPWRRARAGLAALLRPELFREGIDGEAVTWACARLQGRSEARRILLVISDGSPMDSATNLANDEHYLDHRLKEVVAQRERRGLIELFGVGVGLDLSPYYSASHVLDVAQMSAAQCLRELVAMLQRRAVVR